MLVWLGFYKEVTSKVISTVIGVTVLTTLHLPYSAHGPPSSAIDPGEFKPQAPNLTLQSTTRQENKRKAYNF